MLSKTLLVIGVILSCVCILLTGLFVPDQMLRFLSVFSSTALFVIFGVIALFINRSGLDTTYAKHLENLRRERRIKKMARKMRKEKNK